MIIIDTQAINTEGITTAYIRKLQLINAEAFTLQHRHTNYTQNVYIATKVSCTI